MESRRNGPQLSTRHDDDDVQAARRQITIFSLRRDHSVVVCLVLHVSLLNLSVA